MSPAPVSTSSSPGRQSCAQCGLFLNDHRRKGDGPYAGYEYCPRCWDAWEMSFSSSKPATVKSQSGNLTMASLMEMLRPPRAPPGWTPRGMPSATELERLALAADQNASHSVDVVSLDDGGAVIPKDLNLTRPVIFTGIASRWPCVQMTWGEFLQRFGGQKLPWRPCFGDWGHNGAHCNEKTLSEYFSGTPERPGVLFDQDDPQLGMHHALRGLYDIPEALKQLMSARKKTKPVFSAGRRNTGVGMHNHAENWLAQLWGRKMWWLVPRDQPCGEIVCPRQYLLPGKHPTGALSCILHPGEVLYIPGYWHHATWNLDEIAVSLGMLGVAENGAENPSAEIIQALKAASLQTGALDAVMVGGFEIVD
eukprot:gnl/MRDRNA2_/MRDRNA2_137002_c0_seq1.p1 gnl/MRDRNA2_/MRDRNA2_137002_c0~~gnl/MRDRNA2_/MRDRNA2_137002_c0_seq1.p1  ORF type:complete len:377 (+),score=69.98 gnl/MRDRNA2_/MRDRNA2_137002_c0_seq1:39-1133(+)